MKLDSLREDLKYFYLGIFVEQAVEPFLTRNMTINSKPKQLHVTRKYRKLARKQTIDIQSGNTRGSS
jgi:hypothetical protein